jgi:hypothetical protein
MRVDLSLRVALQPDLGIVHLLQLRMVLMHSQDCMLLLVTGQYHGNGDWSGRLSPSTFYTDTCKVGRRSSKGPLVYHRKAPRY